MWQKPESGSYLDLLTRIRKKIRQDEQVNQKMQAAFSAFSAVCEQALTDNNVVRSRPERQRLLEQLLQETVAEFITENK